MAPMTAIAFDLVEERQGFATDATERVPADKLLHFGRGLLQLNRVD